MKIIIYFFSLLVILCSPCCLAASDHPWDSFTKAQQSLLEQGKQVLVTEKVQGSAWPCFHIYRWVQATPSQVAAVFWDVENDPNFIPHCLKATVTERPAPNVMEAKYELQMPIFSNEVSRVRNVLQALPEKEGYEISWDVLSSKYSKSGKGKFLALPHRDGTLICYTNFVNPGSAVASLLSTYAQEQVQQTVSAIAAQVQREIQKKPEQLQQQEEQLNKALP